MKKRKSRKPRKIGMVTALCHTKEGHKFIAKQLKALEKSWDRDWKKLWDT